VDDVVTLLLVLLAAYGVWRLGRYFAKHGLFNHRHEPSGGCRYGFLQELQKAVEPRAVHVEKVKEERLPPAGEAGDDNSRPRPPKN
jgi:hypothetical protein